MLPRSTSSSLRPAPNPVPSTNDHHRTQVRRSLAEAFRRLNLLRPVYREIGAHVLNSFDYKKMDFKPNCSPRVMGLHLPRFSSAWIQGFRGPLRFHCARSHVHWARGTHGIGNQNSSHNFMSLSTRLPVRFCMTGANHAHDHICQP